VGTRPKETVNSLGELVRVIYVCCDCRGAGTEATEHSTRTCPTCKGSGYGSC
jgi:DnaJ-class molecular chaperone